MYICEKPKCQANIFPNKTIELTPQKVKGKKQRQQSKDWQKYRGKNDG